MRGGHVPKYNFSEAAKRKNCYKNWGDFIFKSAKFWKQLKEDSKFWKSITPEQMIYNNKKTRLSINLYTISGYWAYLKKIFKW